MRANKTDFEVYMIMVRVMTETSEKKSNAENYITNLYANNKIDSRQFELLCGMVY